MPPDLKAELLRQSQLSGRSLNQELIVRLRASLAGINTGLTAGTKDEGGNGYTVSDAATNGYTIASTENERQVLVEFRKLSVEKQKALLAMLALFK